MPRTGGGLARQKSKPPKGKLPKGKSPKGKSPKGELPKGELPKGKSPKAAKNSRLHYRRALCGGEESGRGVQVTFLCSVVSESILDILALNHLHAALSRLTLRQAIALRPLKVKVAGK